MIKLKKVIVFIIAISAILIGFFIWYMASGVDPNEVYYRTLIDYENVEYKSVEGDALTVDILMPSRIKYDEVPVVFYIHGGGFVSGEKSDLTDGVRRYLVEDLLDEGYAIVSIDFRELDDDTHFPDNISDIKDAIRYITSVAGEYNFDTDNYGIMGNASGAYLALLVGYTPSGKWTGDTSLIDNVYEIQYVIDFSGLTNISTYKDIYDMSSEELEEAQNELDILYGTDMNINHLDEDDYKIMSDYDPITYVSTDTIPTYIIHGVLDELVDISQSDILEARLLQFEDDGVIYEYYKVLGGNSDLTDLSETEVEYIVSNMMYFIKTYYVENDVSTW